MHKIIRVLASFALASAVTVGVGASAQALYGDCPVGAACIWGNSNYGGTFNADPRSTIYASQYSESSLWWLRNGTNDAASSARTRGQSCNVRFYENVDYTGKSFDFGQPRHNNIVVDSNLSNGAGGGNYKSENWDDRISGWKFMNCT